MYHINRKYIFTQFQHPQGHSHIIGTIWFQIRALDP